MEEMHDRVDLKFKRLEQDGYRFVANPERERLMAKNTAKMLIHKMCANIAERESNGVNQSETKILLLALANSNENSDNITLKRAEKLYKELLIEANAQLGLLQLPEALFGKYKSLIKQI